MIFFALYINYQRLTFAQENVDTPTGLGIMSSRSWVPDARDPWERAAEEGWAFDSSNGY